MNRVNMDALLRQPKEWQLNGNASRIGFRGSYQLTAAIELIYQVESEINFDDDYSLAARGKDTVEQRNTFAGIQGNFGRIIAGRHDTPIKIAGREVDRFNDQVLADVKSFLEGEDRVSDLIMYTTPIWMGFSATAVIITEEDSSKNPRDSGLGDGSSMSLNYSNDYVTAAIAINDNIDKQDITRLMTNFYVGSTEVGFIWQRAERVDISAEEKSWFVSAEHRINPHWRIKGQYGKTDYSHFANEDQQLALGLDRIINSNVFVFVNYVEVDRDKTLDSYTDSSIAIGFQIRFQF